MRGPVLALLAALALAGCGEDERTAAPPPRPLDREAMGYYCNMIVADHAGPKGQIFLADRADPVWFSSVRDTIAFTLLPDEPKNIAAIYVNDMGRASWDSPEPDTWIDARTAWYVIGSRRRGGMGQPEAVPFKEKAAAEKFAAAYGGRVVDFDGIPADYILEAPDETPPHEMSMPDGGSTVGGGDRDRRHDEQRGKQ